MLYVYVKDKFFLLVLNKLFLSDVDFTYFNHIYWVFKFNFH